MNCGICKKPIRPHDERPFALDSDCGGDCAQCVIVDTEGCSCTWEPDSDGFVVRTGYDPDCPTHNLGFDLRDYQADTIPRTVPHASFILADDQGLGKTVTEIAEIVELGVKLNYVLIAGVKSTIGPWYEHIEQGLGGEFEWRDVKVRKTPKYPGGVIKMLYSFALDTHFFVTTWEGLKKEEVQRLVWDMVVADEAHYAKNRKAQRTKALKKIRTTYKRALTGTIFINEPAEAWSILNWLFPRKYTSYWRFFDTHVDYVKHTKGQCEECGAWHQKEFREILGPKNKKLFRSELRPFTIRRLKKDHLKELPDKFYSKRIVDLNPKQKKIYKDIEKEALAWVGEFKDIPLPAPQAISQLQRLRQITGATPVDVEFIDKIEKDGTRKQTIKVELGEPSPKLDAMMDIIVGTEQKVVVFSNYSSVIKLAEERLRKAKIPSVRIIGADSSKKRDAAIHEFQKGKARVFLATIGAGGTGITLTAASIAIFLDRSWSPAQNWQAEDRLHRMGQKSAVEIINVIAKGTVDEDVESKLDLKASWFEALLGR